MYFTLKDAVASVRCVMWRDAAARVPTPREGAAVEAHGHISLYEAGGQYQLYVDVLQPAGQGELYAEFLRLKAKLEAEGLFAADRKRPLPAWPRRIAVVTSSAGAAWRDVQNVMARRFPLAELLLAHTPVQGADAPARIVSALRRADRVNPDVILLVRGGGSIEDLWAFNDESVVRAIAAVETPLVSGVGHETDFTLADFAADLRAPTPSAAAELVSPDREELLRGVHNLRVRLAACARDILREKQSGLRTAQAHLRGVSPAVRLQNVRQQVDDFSRRADSAVRSIVTLRQVRLQGITRLLEGFAPARVLGRGYALVWRNGRLVRTTDQAPAGTELRIQLADGSVRAVSAGRAEKSAVP
jgi:exodeoxyribonuclease VII large subunit